MTTVKERIIELIKRKPGLTDAEIRKELGLSIHQHANNEARSLEKQGLTQRVKEGGLIRNYLVEPGRTRLLDKPDSERISPDTPMSGVAEDDVKLLLGLWLERDGWEVSIAAGKEPGPDVLARQGSRSWTIEVKGSGSRPQMRVNYFLSVLGQILQRMDSDKTRYSVAFPDMPQYRSLWHRLLGEAKKRTGVTALFVGANGEIDEVR